MHAVMREIVRPAGDWTIRAVQERGFNGSPGWYDVFARHRRGTRVPTGPNMHADPGGELDRLEKLIDWREGAGPAKGSAK